MLVVSIDLVYMLSWSFFLPNVTLGLVGSVLAKEGSLPDVSNLVSGAFKVFQISILIKSFGESMCVCVCVSLLKKKNGGNGYVSLYRLYLGN